MDERLVIASALSNNELAKAFSRLVAERWDHFDISPFMVYLVDTCEASALPYLADQFDVAGLQGFAVAENEEQQRELIKRSITLHKFIGTPWAIREACRTVGFPVVRIEEGVAAPEHSDHENDWARFNVIVETDKPVTAEQSKKLRLFIEFYKNERSHLVELGYFHPLTDECKLTCEETFVIAWIQSAACSTAYSKAYSRIKWKAYNKSYSKAYNINN